MTGVLAISFPYQVLVIADCRVTWTTSPRRLQDNLQKLYQFSPTGIIGFAGGVAAAKSLFDHIRAQPKGQDLPPSAADIAQQLASWAKTSYSCLPRTDKVEFELLYAAADYSRVGLAAKNLVFAQNVIVTMAAPRFETAIHSDSAALGYAKSIETNDVLRARNDLVGIGVKEFGANFQAGVVVGTYGDMMARISGEPVGGLFTVAKADARGVTWYPYSYGETVGLAIVGRRFVQFDNRDPSRRTFPLLGVWEFDARSPIFDDLYVRAPALGDNEGPAA